ncbi:MAG: hypothetical protein QM775_36330 [Pirellulales bacterium]
MVELLPTVDSPQPPPNGAPRVRIAVGIWGLLVIAGMAMLTAYANEPGATGEPPQRSRSANPGLQETSHKFQLSMFVHPRCPCSRASVRELARILSRGSSNVDATIYLYRPGRETDDWTAGDLRASAEQIPGLHVQTDPDGRRAAEMGVAHLRRRTDLRCGGGVALPRRHHLRARA